MAIFLALLVCASLAFWLLGGPASWWEIKQTKATEAADVNESHNNTGVAEIERKARRNAGTVWSMLDESLFFVSDDGSLNWDCNDQEPDIDLRSVLTAEEADNLFALFAEKPRLTSMIGLTHCQTRADLMAEIATERGMRLEKLWAVASDLDRVTAVSRFDE